MAKYRALIVGVATTTWGDDLVPLDGVLTDVRNMSDVLDGFTKTVLNTPETTTAERVRGELIDLVASTEDGDLSVIYLAGHGYRTPDSSGDELDGLDECFVCSDGPIVDDWFHETLWPMGHDGARFVVVLDACHSLSAAMHVTFLDPTQIRTIDERYWRLYFAACHDELEALDGNPTDGGVFTSLLVNQIRLREATPPSYRELFKGVIGAASQRRGVPEPKYSSRGPSDALLDAPAFAVGAGQ